MAYLTVSELQDAMGGEHKLARACNSEQVDADLVESAIEDAETTINSYAEGTPGYPYSSTPGKIKQLTIVLSIYNVFERAYGASGVEDSISKGRDRALADLKLLQEGTISVVPGETPAAQNVSSVVMYLPGNAPNSLNPRRHLPYHLRGIKF